MIRIMEVEDIVKILKLNDPNFSTLFSCSVGEWVQFLIQHAEDDNFFMVGTVKDEILEGYLIAYFVELPISKGVSVLYSKTAGKENNTKALLKLKEWANERKAKSIDIVTNNPIGHTVYGFKKSATVMTIKL